MRRIYAVLMAGGAGVRFWPLGRQALPKQFLDLPECNLAGESSLLRRTAQRLERCVARENILVATGSRYKDLVMKQLPWLTEQNLVEEEQNLDTAFAVAGAVQRIAGFGGGRGEEEPLVAFLPCDHYIDNDEKFAADFLLAARAAEHGQLVTLGIHPTFAATEYGYMQARAGDGQEYLTGESFLEKPDSKRAAELWQRQGVFWNCGIFVGRLSVYIEHLERQLAELGCPPADKIADGEGSLLRRAQAVQEAMLAVKLKISFDKLVMEKLQSGEFYIVPASFGWDDLGTFAALGKYWRQTDGNSVKGCELAALESSGNVVYREGGPVALVGVRDLLVVEAGGALLVMPKHESRRLRELVQLLQERGLGEYL